MIWLKDGQSNSNPSWINLIPRPRCLALLPDVLRGLTVVMFEHPAEPLFAANLSYIDISHLL